VSTSDNQSANAIYGSSGLNSFYSSSKYFSYDSSPAKSREGKGQPTVLIVPELNGDFPSPCSYIRLLGPLLSKSIQESFHVRIGNLATALRIPADIIIVNRIPCASIAELDALLEHRRKVKAKLIYEIDDYLISLDSSHPEKSLYKEKEAIAIKLLQEADTVWTSTSTLANNILPLCKEVSVFENYLDLMPAKEKDTFSSSATRKFRILYMGTKTHSADLRMILPALEKLYSKEESFELNLIGVSEEAPLKPWIRTITPPTSIYPLFMQWLRSLPEFDLGIAPLEASFFNECKSAIKYWDYTSLGIPTLASGFGPYESIVSDGQNGLLATNSQEGWYEKLHYVLKNKNALPLLAREADAKLRSLALQLNGAEKRRQAMLASLGKI
jgi:glycosyltransferase involved in cell wall biosynthesis